LKKNTGKDYQTFQKGLAPKQIGVLGEISDGIRQK